MNVASLELCKELYELSGWEDGFEFSHNWYVNSDLLSLCPKYDLGYLLRKLPVKLTNGPYPYWLVIAPMDEGGTWGCAYESPDDVDSSIYDFAADNPEDAACKLAIELFKQGILEREAGDGR